MITLSLAIGDDLGQTAKASRDRLPDARAEQSFRDSLDEEMSARPTKVATVGPSAKRTISDVPGRATPEPVSSTTSSLKTSRAPFASDLSKSTSDFGGLSAGSKGKLENKETSQGNTRKLHGLDNNETPAIPPENKKTYLPAGEATGKQTRAVHNSEQISVSKPENKDAASANRMTPIFESRQISKPDRGTSLNLSTSNLTNKKKFVGSAIAPETVFAQPQVVQSQDTPDTIEKTSISVSMIVSPAAPFGGETGIYRVGALEHVSSAGQGDDASSAEKAGTPDTLSSEVDKVIPETKIIRTDTIPTEKFDITEGHIVGAPSASIQSASDAGPFVQARQSMGTDSVEATFVIAMTASDKTAKQLPSMKLAKPAEEFDVKSSHQPSLSGDTDIHESVETGHGKLSQYSSMHKIVAGSTSSAVTQMNEEKDALPNVWSPSISSGEVADALESSTFTAPNLNFQTLSFAEETNARSLSQNSGPNINERAHNLLPIERRINSDSSAKNSSDVFLSNQNGVRSLDSSKAIERSELSENDSSFGTRDIALILGSTEKPKIHLQATAVQGRSENTTPLARLEAVQNEENSHSIKTNDLSESVDHSNIQSYISTGNNHAVEVNVSDSTQGWIKVRAEIAGDAVHASISSSSSTGLAALHQQIGALNLHLQNERMPATVNILGPGQSGNATSENRSHSSTTDSPQRETGQHNSNSASKSGIESKTQKENSNTPTTPRDADVLHYPVKNGHSLSVLA